MLLQCSIKHGVLQKPAATISSESAGCSLYSTLLYSTICRKLNDASLQLQAPHYSPSLTLLVTKLCRLRPLGFRERSSLARLVVRQGPSATTIVFASLSPIERPVPTRPLWPQMHLHSRR